MVPGGVLAFYCTGRRDQAHPEIQYPDNTMIFTLCFEKAWKDLVNEVNPEGPTEEIQIEPYFKFFSSFEYVLWDFLQSNFIRIWTYTRTVLH